MAEEKSPSALMPNERREVSSALEANAERVLVDGVGVSPTLIHANWPGWKRRPSWPLGVEIEAARVAALVADASRLASGTSALPAGDDHPQVDHETDHGHAAMTIHIACFHGVLV